MSSGGLSNAEGGLGGAMPKRIVIREALVTNSPREDNGSGGGVQEVVVVVVLSW